MESATQEQPGYRIGILGAIAGMVVTFLLGVYVGLHPAWIPIKTSSMPDNGQPVKLPEPKSSNEHSRPATMPQTQPAAK